MRCGSLRRLSPFLTWLLLSFNILISTTTAQGVRLQGLQKQYRVGETAKITYLITDPKVKSFDVALYISSGNNLAFLGTIAKNAPRTPSFVSYKFNESNPAPYNYSFVLQSLPNFLSQWDFELLPAISSSSTASPSSTTSAPSSSPPAVQTPPASPLAPASDNSAVAGIKRTSLAALVVGCIAFVILLIGLVFLFLCLRRRRRDRHSLLPGKLPTHNKSLERDLTSKRPFFSRFSYNPYARRQSRSPRYSSIYPATIATNTHTHPTSTTSPRYPPPLEQPHALTCFNPTAPQPTYSPPRTATKHEKHLDDENDNPPFAWNPDGDGVTALPTFTTPPMSPFPTERSRSGRSRRERSTSSRDWILRSSAGETVGVGSPKRKGFVAPQWWGK